VAALQGRVKLITSVVAASGSRGPHAEKMAGPRQSQGQNGARENVWQSRTVSRAEMSHDLAAEGLAAKVIEHMV
jgi:hypothetical protein